VFFLICILFCIRVQAVYIPRSFARRQHLLQQVSEDVDEDEEARAEDQRGVVITESIKAWNLRLSI
jgi:hypothetical protein